MFRLVLAPLLLSACGGPLRPDDTGAPLGCAEGYHRDAGACVPDACGSGTWGDLSVDEATVYVDVAASEDGDGSEAAPLRSIQTGLDLAGSRGGGTVAVAAGSYPENLELSSDHSGVHLAGRCRELVVLDANSGVEAAEGIRLELAAGEVELSGLSVVGAGGRGILLSSGVARMSSLRVQGSGFVGIVAYRASLLHSTTLELVGCEVLDNVAVGISVMDAGTEATLRDCTLRGTVADDRGSYGYGLQVLHGATLRAEGCEVAGNTSLGVTIGHGETEVLLQDCTVRDTLPDSRGEVGYGVAVDDGAWLQLRGCVLAGNTSAGLYAVDPGTEVQLQDSVVRQTTQDGHAARGYGVYLADGATVQAVACQFEDNIRAGLVAKQPGTGLSLRGCQVRGTKAGLDGVGGSGLGVAEGASLWAEGCEIHSNKEAAVTTYGAGSVTTILDSVLRDTRPDEQGHYGHGLYVYEGASLLAEGVQIRGCTNAGVMVQEAGTEVVLRDCAVLDTRPDPSGDYGHGILVVLGASLLAEGCLVRRATSEGVLVDGASSVATFRNCTVADTRVGYGSQGLSGKGIVVQEGAMATAEGVWIQDNAGPGLYVVEAGAAMSFADGAILDNEFAGVVVIDGGALEIRSSTISGTGESTDLGGGVGVFAGERSEGVSPMVRLIDNDVSNNLGAGVHLLSEGSYTLIGNDITTNASLPHGATTRCGHGIYAFETQAWDGSTGLLLEGNSIASNQGTGLFLDDGWARLAGNDWSGNSLDLLVQGEACLSPSDDYSEAPVQELCPEWSQPICEIDFTLVLSVEDLEPAMRVPVTPAPRPPQPRFEPLPSSLATHAPGSPGTTAEKNRPWKSHNRLVGVRMVH